MSNDSVSSRELQISAEGRLAFRCSMRERAARVRVEIKVIVVEATKRGWLPGAPSVVTSIRSTSSRRE